MIEEFWAQNQLTITIILQSILIGVGALLWQDKSWDDESRIIVGVYVLLVIPFSGVLLFYCQDSFIKLVLIQYGGFLVGVVILGMDYLAGYFIKFMKWSLK